MKANSRNETGMLFVFSQIRTAVPPQVPNWRCSAGVPTRVELDGPEKCEENEERSHHVIENKGSRLGTNPKTNPKKPRTKPNLATRETA
jgi:hypothetical protein